MKLIIDAIPSSVMYFNYSFHPGFDNFIPFNWRGFTVIPRYSFKLDISIHNSHVYSTSITNHLRKAAKNELICNTVNTPDAILMLAKTRELVNQNTRDIFKKLCTNLLEHDKGLLLTITDRSDNIHSAAVFAISGLNAYMILSIVNPEYKKYGGNALLMTEAFRRLRTCGVEWFYFEGSMFENVEAYISGFRAEKVLYFNIVKSKLPLLNNVILPIRDMLTKNKTPAL